MKLRLIRPTGFCFFCMAIAFAALLPRLSRLVGGKDAVAASTSECDQSDLAAVKVAPALITKPIETIICGDRIASDAPSGMVLTKTPEPRPDAWRLVELKLKKSDGGIIDVKLLRSVEWLQLKKKTG